jgi:DNA (cytosine-5)-methyltransferase 1
VLPLVDPHTAVEALLPTPRATDGTKGCPAQRGNKGDLMLPSVVVRLLTPTTDQAGGTATRSRPVPTATPPTGQAPRRRR